MMPYTLTGVGKEKYHHLYVPPKTLAFTKLPKNNRTSLLEIIVALRQQQLYTEVLALTL